MNLILKQLNFINFRCLGEQDRFIFIKIIIYDLKTLFPQYPRVAFQQPSKN